MIKTISIVFAVYFGLLFLFFALCWYKARNDRGDFLIFIVPATLLHGTLLAGAVFLIARDYAN